MTRVPLVCAYAHCYTISRKVLANSAMKCMVHGDYPYREFNMPDQSRELNMLACLFAVLASGSFARFHCDVFHFFFYTMSFFFFLSTSSKTVALRCSFCFHVDSNRATADASNESRLSASRDIRCIRTAITAPSQYH